MKKIKGFITLMIALSSALPVLNAQNNMDEKGILGSKEKSIIVISALTAKGDLVILQPALNTGLDAGLTINEIKEVLVHLYAYCGFPRSIRGLQTFMEVLQTRKAKGINDIAGAEASPIKDEAGKYERGKKILGDLTGVQQPATLSGYSAFAPAIDSFLKEHLFADIFERDVLTYAQRELVTIAVIAAIGDAEPMLQSHLTISLRVGWSPQQLKEFVTVITPAIGNEKANAANAVLKQVLSRHQPK